MCDPMTTLATHTYSFRARTLRHQMNTVRQICGNTRHLATWNSTRKNYKRSCCRSSPSNSARQETSMTVNPHINTHESTIEMPRQTCTHTRGSQTEPQDAQQTLIHTTNTQSSSNPITLITGARQASRASHPGRHVSNTIKLITGMHMTWQYPFTALALGAFRHLPLVGAPGSRSMLALGSRPWRIACCKASIHTPYPLWLPCRCHSCLRVGWSSHSALSKPSSAAYQICGSFC